MLAHVILGRRRIHRRGLRSGLRIGDLMLANERSARTEHEIRDELRKIWDTMQACVRRGCAQEGVLPGGLNVLRRAASLRRALQADAETNDPLRAMDWLELYALAVNEENAAGGRVVTAPTNGAAGIVPAVLHYYRDFSPGFVRKASYAFCSQLARSELSTSEMPRSLARMSGARARSAQRLRWPPQDWPRHSAERLPRSRTLRRSRWSTTWG